MQQCTSCDTPLTAEESICPYCNTPKTSYIPAQKASFERLDLLGGTQASFEINAPPTLQNQAPPNSHTLRARAIPLTPPSAEPNTNMSRKAILLTAIISACVIGLGIVGYRAYYTNIYYPNQLHSQATATADSVTAAAVGGAYAATTATATASDPQSIYTNITNETPTFTDSLASESTSDWTSEAGTKGDTCDFENQALYIKTNSLSTFFPCYGQHIFGNFIFKVRMTILNGDGGVILFRAALGDQHHYYALFIHPTGQFTLDVYKSPSSSDAKMLTRAYLPGFATGLNQLNSIAILARDNVFSLFVNEKYVTDIVDASSSYNQGVFGLGALENKFATTVAFNYVQVWSL